MKCSLFFVILFSSIFKNLYDNKEVSIRKQVNLKPSWYQVSKMQLFVTKSFLLIGWKFFATWILVKKLNETKSNLNEKWPQIYDVVHA